MHQQHDNNNSRISLVISALVA